MASTHSRRDAALHPRRSPLPLPLPSTRSSPKPTSRWLATRHKRCRENFYVTLASWAPYPQLLIFALFLSAAALAGFGFWLEPDSSLAPRRALFWIWLVVAFIGISEALVAGDAVTDAYHDGQRTMATAKNDEARLHALFVRHDGQVEPFRQRDLDFAKALQQARTIPDVASVASSVPMRFFLSLLPAALFFWSTPASSTRATITSSRGIRSKQQQDTSSAHRRATSNLQRVGEALKTNPEHLFDPPPLHETLNKNPARQSVS